MRTYTDEQVGKIWEAAEYLDAVSAQMLGLPQTQPPRLVVGASMCRAMAYDLRSLLDAPEAEAPATDGCWPCARAAVGGSPCKTHGPQPPHSKHEGGE